MTPTLALLASSVLAVGCATRPPDDPAPVAEGSDRAFAHTVETTATPDAIWEAWTDVAGWPRWDVELESARLDGPFEDGAEGTLAPRSGPSARFRIDEVEPGRAYTLTTRLPLGSLRVHRAWSPIADGRISVTHSVTFSGLGGRLLAGRLGPRFRRALPVALDRLRDLAEDAP